MRQNVAPLMLPTWQSGRGGVTFSHTAMNTTKTHKRTAGSCRFDPYYKLEWYDHRIGAWRPLQRSFATFAEAEAARTKNKVWRIFEVTEETWLQ
jgi:hypothetical protein